MTAHFPSAPLHLAAAQRRDRNATLDIARGIGIILVVWGHGIIGVQGALGDTPAGRFAITAIYAVHMPLFFFISGLLSRSAAIEPARSFAGRITSRILYPYLLWGAAILAIHHGMSDVTNTRVESFDPMKLLYRPPAVMWFLYVLFFCFLAARALRSASPSVRLGVGLALAITGCLVEGWLLPYLRFVGIFIAGTAFRPAQVLSALDSPRLLALAAVALASALVFAWAAADEPLHGYPAAGLRYLPAAAGGIVLALAGARAIAGAPLLARPLAWLGAGTMPIYVTHILVLAALRIVLLRSGVADPVLIVAIIVPCGLLLPLAASAIADRLGISRALGWK